MGVKGLIVTLTLFGSMSVSDQLHTYPFLNPRLTLTCYQLTVVVRSSAHNVRDPLGSILVSIVSLVTFCLDSNKLSQNSQQIRTKTKTKPHPRWFPAFSPRASHRRRSCLLFRISHPLQRVNLHQTLRTEKFFFKAIRN